MRRLLRETAERFALLRGDTGLRPAPLDVRDGGQAVLLQSMETGIDAVRSHRQRAGNVLDIEAEGIESDGFGFAAPLGGVGIVQQPQQLAALGRGWLGYYQRA